MKEVPCYQCGTMTEVEDDYEPMGCCSGVECACAGTIVNPVFCDKCMEVLYPGENG